MALHDNPIQHVRHSCCTGKYTLSDNTGQYDANLNVFGWQPNGTTPQTAIQLQDVESSALTVTSPSGAVYGPYDVIAQIPSLSGNTIEIDLTDILGSGDDAPAQDGYWSFDWVVKGEYPDGVGGDTPFHARCLQQELVLCDAQCCVDKLQAESDPSCGCTKGGNKKAVNAMLTLESKMAKDDRGDKQGAKNLLSKLQDICNNKCKNC